jgi:hypothetical protein
MAADIDSRGRTDLTSNTVFLSRFNGSQYIAWLRNRSARIEDELAQFLHEFTHHWCFNSYVGRALALIRLRSQIALALDKTPSVPIEVDLAKYESAKMMLGPLAEGMALFAEFDLTPRDSPILSQTSLAALVCFGFPLKTDDKHQGQGPMLALQLLLQNSRVNTDCLHERKAPLYLRAFDIDDGYLPGYLAIKNIYVRATSRAKVLFDNEAFLCYVREVVFNDVELAMRLLRRNTSEIIQEAQDVATRVHARLGWLAESAEIAADAEAFVSHVLSPTAGQSSGAGVDWAPSLEHEFQTLFGSELAETLSLLDKANETERVLGGLVVDALSSRQLLVIASVAVTITVTEGKLHLKLDDIDLGQFSETEHAWEDRGTLSVIVSSSACFLVVMALTDGSHTELVQVFGELNDDDAEAARTYAITNALRGDLCDLLSKTFQERVSKNGRLSVIQEHIQKNTRRSATELYASLSTLVVPDEECDRARETLKRSGFAPFLGGDVRLAKVLALIGIGHTMNADVAMLCHFIGPRSGVSAERMEEGLNRLRTVKPYPLIFGDMNRVYAPV